MFTFCQEFFQIAVNFAQHTVGNIYFHIIYIYIFEKTENKSDSIKMFWDK